jgi:hypothetical protein
MAQKLRPTGIDVIGDISWVHIFAISTKQSRICYPHWCLILKPGWKIMNTASG